MSSAQKQGAQSAKGQPQHTFQPPQQYSQSAMRNHVRLAKKVNSNNMAGYLEVAGLGQVQHSGGGAPAAQTFNKTMNAFSSNQTMNLTGQKMLISATHQPHTAHGTQNQSQTNLSNLNMQNLNLQHVETTSSSMHQAKLLMSEDKDRATLSNGGDHVLNSANLNPFEHMSHAKGHANLQLQQQQSEHSLESRKILLGLTSNRMNQGIGVQPQANLTKTSNSRHATGEARMESSTRPQSQNNRMTGVVPVNQHGPGMQTQQSQQFNQMHLNSLTHHNLSKAKQLSFSPGYSQQIQHGFNQDQMIKQQIMSIQQMHSLQTNPIRGSNLAHQTQQFINQSGSQMQGSPVSQKSAFPSQPHSVQKAMQQQAELQQQSSPIMLTNHANTHSASQPREQKLLSLKHIQIQQARMVSSQSDNGSENEATAQSQLQLFNGQQLQLYTVGQQQSILGQIQSGNISAAQTIVSTGHQSQGPPVQLIQNMSGLNSQNVSGLSLQQLQALQVQQHMGLTPQQKQEKLNIIRANSLQNKGGKFIKNQLSQMHKNLEDQSNHEGSNHDIFNNTGEHVGKMDVSPLISLNGPIKRDMSPGNPHNFDSTRLAGQGGTSPDAKLQSSMHQSGLGLKNENFGMTLEDDVESMLSDQFNTSNESMFKVRGVAASGQAPFGGGLAGGGGDSTFRCNDSIQDEDRGLISESEDGWYADRDNQRKEDQEKQDFGDISEHSSDEMTDSEPEIIGDQVVKKTKKKGEKGERKKKKRKKAEQQQNDIKHLQMQLQQQEDAQFREGKLAQAYKGLEGLTRDDYADKPDKHYKIEKTVKQVSKKETKTDQKQTKEETKKNKKKDMNTTQIKVNLERKNKQSDGNQKIDIKVNSSGKQDQFMSPNVKSKNEKQQTVQSKSDTVNKKTGKQINEKKEVCEKDVAKQLAIDSKLSQMQQSVAATPVKKPKKNGLKLQALNHALPKNLQECYDRFFESGFKINPQFEYENAQSAAKFLEQFVEPDGMYLQIAQKILDSFLKEYGSESSYLDAEGRKLGQEETHEHITKYLQNLDVEEWIQINFQKNQVAPTSVTHDPKTGKCKMNIKLPCEYREGRMMGVLDHEIGTHFLRKHNEKSQVWYKKREKYDLKTCIATEEGLACTNQMVQTVKDGRCRPFLYRSALNYYAAFMAKELSFVDLFRDLERYVDSPQARWKFTLRVKRGLSDTSQKGGLYKDQVYLEGAVKILQQRHTLNFKALLCGKLSLDDYHRDQIQNLLVYEDQLLPPFMEDMEEYKRCLDVIGKCNHIIALDEISDSESNSALKIQDSSEPKNTETAPRIIIDDTYDVPVNQAVSVTNFLNENSEGLHLDQKLLSISLKETGGLNSSFNGMTGDTTDQTFLLGDQNSKIGQLLPDQENTHDLNDREEQQ